MHWTYANDLNSDDDLYQGDILDTTQELLDLFQKVYPYFTNSRYRGFLVLTHSCDLVRRQEEKNRCSATHICLCVIRSLPDVISDSLDKTFGYLAPGVYNQRMKKAVEMLLERIVNQNENSLGLFYLHPDADAGITVPSVAMLRVTISFRANEHYETIRKSRIGRLSKEFQPKLGWIAGNIYSRVGVKDWKEESKEEEARIIKEILRFKRDEPLWVDKHVFKKITVENPNFLDLTPLEQEEVIKCFSPEPPVKKAIIIIKRTVKSIIPKATDDILEKIENRLLNDEVFESQLKKIAPKE
jgi:hypothetical protein